MESQKQWPRTKLVQVAFDPSSVRVYQSENSEYDFCKAGILESDYFPSRTGQFLL